MRVDTRVIMNNEELELLVYLQDEVAEQALERLRSHFSVTQMASRQLAIVRVSPGQEREVQSVEGVQGVFERTVPENLFTHLNFSESLFVKAWTLRNREGSKERPGEGLDWDAEGFEPPGISEGDWI
jgi:hypothetical protein